MHSTRVSCAPYVLELRVIAMLKIITECLQRKKKHQETIEVSEERLYICHISFMEIFGKCILELETSLDKPTQIKERTKHDIRN